jgi:hypothetical protein
MKARGAISDYPVSWSTPDGRRAQFCRWYLRIIREVSRSFPPGPERAAAAEFARSHRLSVANAFTRRIVRPDVVRALADLYRLIRTPDQDN